jgi:hypothetical protein
MGGLCKLIWWAVVGLFRSRISLEAENLVLRHQLNVLRRKSPARSAFSGVDRMVFAGLYALAPNALDALKIVKPDTVIRWHRAGFRGYWRWKSRARGGRPSTAADIRKLIGVMPVAATVIGDRHVRTVLTAHDMPAESRPGRSIGRDEPDHPRFRITENAAHRRFRPKTREAIRIPKSPTSSRRSRHPPRMPNRRAGRNPKSLGNAQPSRAFRP